MTAEVPDIDVFYTTDAPAIPSARNGYAKKMAIIGAFDTVEENPVLFNTLTEAYTAFGDDTENYDGCKVIDKLFNQASSVLAVNITRESEGVRDKTITTLKLTEALAKIKGEDWDTLFVAGILTSDFLPIIAHFLDESAKKKYPCGFSGAINGANVSANVGLAGLVGDHCYGVINQSLSIGGTEYDLLDSSAYYASVIAGLPVGNSMTMKQVPGVTGVNPELTFETGDDGTTLVGAGITVFKCQDRTNNRYVVVNSEQPNGLDLYINRVRDYVVKEMSLHQFLGDRNRPKTYNEIVQELDRIKDQCTNPQKLDLLKDINYSVVKESRKCVGIYIDSLTFEDIITHINMYVRVKVE